jgi:hypothetical protein
VNRKCMPVPAKQAAQRLRSWEVPTAHLATWRKAGKSHAGSLQGAGSAISQSVGIVARP